MGITCNESREDDHGWDHIVEFSPEAVQGLSADLQRAIPPVFVQTKSHETENLTVRMKLSNALKLARHNSPCFVVLMIMANDGVAPSWYAVHFWGDLASRALKKAREASRDGIPEAEFHKRWFSFTMSSSDAQDEQKLLSWIAATVRSAGPDYSTAKQALLPEQQIVGTIKFSRDLSLEQLVDHQIGLSPTIPVEAISLNLRRFGVDIPLPLPAGVPDFASIHVHPSAQCEMRLRGPDNVEIEVAGDVLAPGIYGVGDQRKIRFRTFLLDLVCSMNGMTKTTLHLDARVRRSPSDIEKMVRLASWAGQGAIDFRVSVGDRRLLAAVGPLDSFPEQPGYAVLTELLGSLVRVSKHLKTKIPEISVEEVIGSEWVSPFHKFLTATDMNLSVPLVDDIQVEGLRVGIAGAIAPVGSWIFAVIQRLPISEYSKVQNILSIKFGSPEILETYAFERNDEETWNLMKADLERLSSEIGSVSMDNVLLAYRPLKKLINLRREADKGG